MPTTSQVQVLDKLNVPNKISRKKVSTSLKLPKSNINLVTNRKTKMETDVPDKSKLFSKVSSLSTLSTAAERQDINSDYSDVDEGTVDRLHELGFWDVKESNEKIGVSNPKEVDFTEFNNQYTKKLVDGIMEQVKNCAAKRQPPQEIPTALCFSMRGSITSHEEVKDKIESLLYLCRDCKVMSIQYLPLKTRWLVIMDKKDGRDRLAGNEIQFRGQKVMLRRYDDIASLEYRKYERANGLMNIVNNPV